MNQQPTTSQVPEVNKEKSIETLQERISAVTQLEGPDGLLETLIQITEEKEDDKDSEEIVEVAFKAHVAILRQLIEVLHSKKLTKEEVRTKYGEGFMIQYGMRKKVDELIENWYH